MATEKRLNVDSAIVDEFFTKDRGYTLGRQSMSKFH